MSTNKHKCASSRCRKFKGDVKQPKPPPEGWNSENVSQSDMAAINRAIVDINRTRRAIAARQTSSKLSAHMRKQVEDVVSTALSIARRRYGIRGQGNKSDFMLELGEHEDLWAQAIALELGGDATVEIIGEPKRTLHNNVYEKVGVVLGHEPTPEQLRNLRGRRWEDIAQHVGGIDDTTREALRNRVAQGVANGHTVFEVAEDVRNHIPQIATNRVPTIVRTEMGRASDDATKLAMKDSGVVTHMSVVGCEAIEPNIPTYNGIPTCNIEMVPIEDEHLLEFHINHTGMIVAAAFAEPDVLPEPEPIDPEQEIILTSTDNLTDAELEQLGIRRRPDVPAQDRDGLWRMTDDQFDEYLRNRHGEDFDPTSIPDLELERIYATGMSPEDVTDDVIAGVMELSDEAFAAWVIRTYGEDVHPLDLPKRVDMRWAYIDPIHMPNPSTPPTVTLTSLDNLTDEEIEILGVQRNRPGNTPEPPASVILTSTDNLTDDEILRLGLPPRVDDDLVPGGNPATMLQMDVEELAPIIEAYALRNTSVTVLQLERVFVEAYRVQPWVFDDAINALTRKYSNLRTTGLQNTFIWTHRAVEDHEVLASEILWFLNQPGNEKLTATDLMISGFNAKIPYPVWTKAIDKLIDESGLTRRQLGAVLDPKEALTASASAYTILDKALHNPSWTMSHLKAWWDDQGGHPDLFELALNYSIERLPLKDVQYLVANGVSRERLMRLGVLNKAGELIPSKDRELRVFPSFDFNDNIDHLPGLDGKPLPDTFSPETNANSSLIEVATPARRKPEVTPKRKAGKVKKRKFKDPESGPLSEEEIEQYSAALHAEDIRLAMVAEGEASPGLSPGAYRKLQEEYFLADEAASNAHGDLEVLVIKLVEEHNVDLEDDLPPAALKEMKDLEKKVAELSDKSAKAKAKLQNAQLRKTVAYEDMVAPAPGKLRKKLKVNDDFTEGGPILRDGDKEAIKKDLDKGLDFVDHITNVEAIYWQKRDISLDARDRAAHSAHKKKIYLNPQTDDGVTATHELGHELEAARPTVGLNSQEFLAKRAERVGATIQQHPNMPPEEIFLLTDKGEHLFVSDQNLVNGIYAGRVYGDDNLGGKVNPNKLHGTEVMSVGVERLRLDPVGFAQEDPEWFNFVVGNLHRQYVDEDVLKTAQELVK